MKSLWLVVAVVFCTAAMFAQINRGSSGGARPGGGQASRPNVSRSSGVVAVGNGGWWDAPGGTTAAGSAMNGMASMISAKAIITSPLRRPRST